VRRSPFAETPDARPTGQLRSIVS